MLEWLRWVLEHLWRLALLLLIERLNYGEGAVVKLGAFGCRVIQWQVVGGRCCSKRRPGVLSVQRSHGRVVGRSALLESTLPPHHFRAAPFVLHAHKHNTYTRRRQGKRVKNNEVSKRGGSFGEPKQNCEKNAFQPARKRATARPQVRYSIFRA